MRPADKGRAPPSSFKKAPGGGTAKLTGNVNTPQLKQLNPKAAKAAKEKKK